MLRDFKISLEENSVLWKRGGHDTFGVRDAYTCWLFPTPLPSQKSAFGWIRSQPKLLFLLGRARGGRFSPWIGFKNGSGNSLIAVFCVVVKRKM